MSVGTAGGGRAASIARRQALSAGKAALGLANKAPSPAQAVANGEVRQVVESAPPSFAPAPANGREIARARRADLSRRGRGDAAAAPPSRAPRPALDGGSSPIGTATTGGRLTASRIGTGSHVTGIADVRFGRGLAELGTSPKVGFTRTIGGSIVSGTLVRSKVPVTGDESGAAITVTGEADQRLEDDLTERQAAQRPQYARTADPHGGSVFSRRSPRQAAIEMSLGGLPVTGTAVGTSSRVTGDEALVRRGVTGNQYLAPERSGANGVGARLDPVTGGKVSIGLTHGLQRITGIAVEADPRVTGNDGPVCTCITGSQYTAPPAEPPPARERGFSVRTPHHSAQPRANALGITGSFANGDDKVTGNREFFFRPRESNGDARAARLRVSGEGSNAGRAITGSAWGEQSNVTGIEGAAAGSRNPSERAGTPQAFAGARHFKVLASHEEPKHLVTGMSGYSSDSGARVTLSGGAQG